MTREEYLKAEREWQRVNKLRPGDKVKLIARPEGVKNWGTLSGRNWAYDIDVMSLPIGSILVAAEPDDPQRPDYMPQRPDYMAAYYSEEAAARRCGSHKPGSYMYHLSGLALIPYWVLIKVEENEEQTNE